MALDEREHEEALERVAAMEALAERVLAECRITLMMAFRFLDRALWKLPFVSLRFAPDTSTKRIATHAMLSCDGHAIYYDPKRVIATFRAKPDVVTRAYLHTLLHCVFRHPFHTVRADRNSWSLACDACIEAIAIEMCAGRFPLENDDMVRDVASRLTALCNGVTPSKVYRMLLLSQRDEGSIDQLRLAALLEEYRNVFAHDNHQFWDLVEPPQRRDDPSSSGGNGQGDDAREDESGKSTRDDDDASKGNVDGDGQDSNHEPDEDCEAPQSEDEGEGDTGDTPEQGDAAEAGSDEEGRIPPENGQPDDEHSQPPQPQKQERRAQPMQADARKDEGAYSKEEGEQESADEQEWEQIARQVETALQTLEKEHGDTAGTFMDNLALVNRSKIDYEDFLRRFATTTEDARLNDEEFDYIFYTYGLKLYENMPLIEPLEYKETERIREFVIAIDTSGSCSRGLIEVFLTRTYEILSGAQGFDGEVNVHIIQCDAAVQSDTVIHDMAELSEYERGFTVFGYGGTDFRPVFAYVDDLIARKEFSDLRGLVYFTDGYGTFPANAPDYDVAFVFVEEEGKQRRVPPWAMKVVLDADTLFAIDREPDGKTPRLQ